MNDRITNLIDESLKKHYNTKILDMPFDVNRPASGARVKPRFFWVGFATTCLAAIIIFMGISAVINSNDHEINKHTSAENDKKSYASDKEYNYEEEAFDYFLNNITISGNKLTTPITVGELKKYADTYSSTPYDNTKYMLVFADRQKGEPCLTAYVDYSVPQNDNYIKEIYVSKDYYTDNIKFGSAYVGMDIGSLMSSFKHNSDIKIYADDGSDKSVVTIKNDLGYYIRFEFKDSILSDIRLVMREGGLDPDSEKINNDPNANESFSSDNYCELELHSDQRPQYTYEEFDALIHKGMEEYEHSGRRIIDKEKYVNAIINGTLDKNSLEAKSYIYHMMLNSVDYFNSAEGAMNFESRIDISFKTNIQKGMSYESCVPKDAMSYEVYVSDGIRTSVNPQAMEYSEESVYPTYITSPAKYVISDNDRAAYLIDGDEITANTLVDTRDDTTNLGISGEYCLFPQRYATNYLPDFDTWYVSDITEMFGRKCAEIESVSQQFGMTVDLETGIMFEYKAPDENGTLAVLDGVKDIVIDNDPDIQSFDKSGYTKVEDICKD